MNLPARPACQLVPQATIFTSRKFLNSCSVMSISSRKTLPVSCEMRPSRVSRTARGCSKISFCMKCLKPPFSAMMGSQVMCWAGRVMAWLSKSNRRTPCGVSTATSPSPRKKTLRVCARIAGMSLATKNSFSPRPTTMGGPRRAATILLGSLVETATSA